MGTILHAGEPSLSYLAGETDFEFRKINWAAGGNGSRYIAGELINKAERSFAWVRVEFALYDGCDALLGKASDLLIGCAASAVWKFRATVSHDRVVRASLPVISTEFGREQAHSFALNAKRSAESANEVCDVDFERFSPLSDSIMGKARTQASAIGHVKSAHWSQVRK